MKDSSAVKDFTGLKFPPASIEYAMFEGFEQEGPLKGKFTLFIVGPMPYEDILAQLSIKDYDQIYFGAGGRFDYHPKSVEVVYKNINSDVIVTVENPVIDFDLMDSCENLHWMCPMVWHGEAVPNAMASLAKLSEKPRYYDDTIIVKIDTGLATYSAYYGALKHSSYGDYSADKLIMQKERQ